jgi:hypothetical protein
MTGKGIYRYIGMLFLTIFITGIVSGCTGKKDPGQKESLQVGSWAGTVTTNARLVKKLNLNYWNGAWRVEADVRLNEFQDGSLKGTATGSIFVWNNEDSLMKDYDQIAQGPYNQYTTFQLDLTGTVTDKGYELKAVELPVSLPDPGHSGQVVEFWDFMYPGEMQGNWPDGSRVIEGDSIRPQGKDLQTTMAQEDYRDSSVRYTWSIKPL